jgi:hypothetical protein
LKGQGSVLSSRFGDEPQSVTYINPNGGSVSTYTSNSVNSGYPGANFNAFMIPNFIPPIPYQPVILFLCNPENLNFKNIKIFF